jgi:hypothetical protein
MCASMGHGYFQSQKGCEEVIFAVPYITGFIFCIAVFFIESFPKRIQKKSRGNLFQIRGAELTG